MKAIRHVGIIVKDLDKILGFYKGLLGLKVRIDTVERGKYIDSLFALKDVEVRIIKLAAEDGNLIELLCFKSHPCVPLKKEIPDIGYSHVSFTVENLDREYERLKEKGIRFNHSPQVSPDGKAKVVYCRDPEGNFVELVEELKISK